MIAPSGRPSKAAKYEVRAFFSDLAYLHGSPCCYRLDPLHKPPNRALTAAVEGVGVAIGRSLLVADAISDGRLIPALAAAPYVLSTKVHVARWGPDLIGDGNTQVLVKWLAQAAEETNCGVLNGSLP